MDATMCTLDIEDIEDIEEVRDKDEGIITTRSNRSKVWSLSSGDEAVDLMRPEVG